MEHPQIDSGPRGGPYSPRFGDTYHALGGAWGQAMQVFVEGCHLPGQWASDRPHCTVLENGFGLGVNFLATWARWREDGTPRPLHYVSLEAFPPTREQLDQWLPALIPAAEHRLFEILLDHWPAAWMPGLQRVPLGHGAPALWLGVGDSRELVTELRLHADALYLDGFAPDRNPEMWDEHLLHRLSQKLHPQGRASTWCVAGAVRQALASAGLQVERRPGYGGKRHRLEATVHPARRAAQRARAPAAPPKQATVIGAGLAGAHVARALAERGCAVEVIGAATHQGHTAALTPLVQAAASPRVRLLRAGWRQALLHWQKRPGIRIGGALQLGGVLERSDPQALNALLSDWGWPGAWVQPLDQAQASCQAGLAVGGPALWFAEALQVQIQTLVDDLLEHPGISLRRIEPGALLSGDWTAPEMWASAQLGARAEIRARTQAAWSPEHPVVVCAGAASTAWLQAQGLPQIPLSRVAGQVFAVEHPHGLRCTVAGHGYAVPALDQRLVVLGSTYEHEGRPALSEQQAQKQIRQQTEALWAPGQVPSWGAPRHHWSGWRCGLPDRMPLVGAWPACQGLWIATAFGSRGLSVAALAAEMVASALWDEPAPLEQSLLDAAGFGRRRTCISPILQKSVKI